VLHQPTQHRQGIAQVFEHVAKHQDVRGLPDKILKRRVWERLDIAAKHRIQRLPRHGRCARIQLDPAPAHLGPALPERHPQRPAAATQLQHTPRRKRQNREQIRIDVTEIRGWNRF